jgi:hypothetical protein
MNERTEPQGSTGTATAPTRGRPEVVPDAATTGLVALIREAEALHEALAAARSRAGRLVVALRKQKRRERLVAATLASLRQLRLQDVVD